jgi:hypothetical protein
VPKRSVPGAEVVQRNPAAGLAQRVDKPSTLVDIVERRGFGYLDNEAAREIGPATQDRNERARPRPVACGQPRYVEAERHVRMGHKLLNGLLECEAIDIANQSESLDGRDKLCARNKISRLVAHPEQTLEITDFSGLSVHYWLEGEEQTVVA